MTVTAAELGGVYLVPGPYVRVHTHSHTEAHTHAGVHTHVCSNPILTGTQAGDTVIPVLKVITPRPEESSHVTRTHGPSIRALPAVS